MSAASDRRDLLLLPGSDGRSAVWSRVATLLRDRGHHVATHTGWSRDGLVDHAVAVRDVLTQGWVDTLVTWSYSGLVGSLAATDWDPTGLLVHVDPLLGGGIRDDDGVSPQVPPVVRRLIGDDVEAAITPVVPACREIVVACARRPDKPAFAAVQRSVDWAVRTGLEVRWIDSGHGAMREAPQALADLLHGIGDDVPFASARKRI